MQFYSEAAMERAMKVQEVMLRAIGKRITWWQAAEIPGISCRSLRRWKRRYERWGYDGLYDRRRGKPSPRRTPAYFHSSRAQGRLAVRGFCRS